MYTDRQADRQTNTFRQTIRQKNRQIRQTGKLIDRKIHSWVKKKKKKAKYEAFNGVNRKLARIKQLDKIS